MCDIILKDNISYVSFYVHCGVEILSVSKGVMNKVCSCCDDCSIKVYFRDTDSIHLNYDDVDEIVERCKQNMTKS